MSASMPTAEPESHRSDPTLDLHTDAIILREGAGAVCSTYLRGSSSCRAQTTTSTPTPTSMPTATTTSLSISGGTPTASEVPPFVVRRTAFRAAAPLITVRPGPATERARRREEAAEAVEAARASSPARAAPNGRTHGASPRSDGAESADTRSPPWAFFAALALGAALAAFADVLAGRALEAAALASAIAGVVILSAALSPPRPRG